jgi:GalNAc5-diNAcBac-PP-undecaprenol beta-1,3-glucosyltransferase
MPRATVVIPTHDHVSTLPLAVASVQAQGVGDVEILILGDGVDDATRDAVGQLRADDPRIRFFDLPKGERHGELYRDDVLRREAQGRIICYQCDDDLWLPGHLEAVERALETADFVGAMHVDVDPGDRVHGYFFDLERPEFVDPWLAWTPNRLGDWASDGFGLAFAAHTLEAYLRLPTGWSTTPQGLPTDQFMWHKFKREPWCRTAFLHFPISLHFPAQDRLDWTPSARADELRRWTTVLERPDGTARLWDDLLADLGERLLQRALRDRATRDGGEGDDAHSAGQVEEPPLAPTAS